MNNSVENPLPARRQSVCKRCYPPACAPVVQTDANCSTESDASATTEQQDFHKRDEFATSLSPSSNLPAEKAIIHLRLRSNTADSEI